MQNPAVTFIIPCFKLAHLLRECVDSILGQTFGDLEILIMDDCSPDQTPEVAGSYRDPRVKHIRNEPNLGHLRNYNKGISLARGKYVWLISADDYLRTPYVLQRYLEVLEKHPEVGYAFCPGTCVSNRPTSEVARWVLQGQKVYGDRDRIIRGHALLKTLLFGNTIVSASGLVRRQCYEKISVFPLNMPWAGDWYLWCVFALFHEVAYFAEPMVCYRDHDSSMTTSLMQNRAAACAAEEVEILFTLKSRADEAGLGAISEMCLQALANHYMQSRRRAAQETMDPRVTLDPFEKSLCQNGVSEAERDWICARLCARIGDDQYWRGDLATARESYRAGLHRDPWMPRVHAKNLLLSLGKFGDLVRRGFRPSGVSKATTDGTKR